MFRFWQVPGSASARKGRASGIWFGHEGRHCPPGAPGEFEEKTWPDEV